MSIDRRSAGLMVRLVYCGSATGLMVMPIDSVVYSFVGVDVDFVIIDGHETLTRSEERQGFMDLP